MATMVKEKKGEKKKPKKKSISNISPIVEPVLYETILTEDVNASALSNECIEESITKEITTEYKSDPIIHIDNQINVTTNSSQEEFTDEEDNDFTHENSIQTNIQLKENTDCTYLNLKINREHTHKELSDQLKQIQFCEVPTTVINKTVDVQTSTLVSSQTQEFQSVMQEDTTPNTIPSAPVLEEMTQCSRPVVYEEVAVECEPKITCMPIENIMKLYGGVEMAEVREMSEKEEAIVEAGPLSGPEHPLVDLLSTFRSSLISLEIERTQLICSYADEVKTRSTLWKIEKRSVNLVKTCSCGVDVKLIASFEHAKLLKERLPIAKLWLEGLLRDVQDSYCHHQHSALLAYCQIDDIISDTVHSYTDVIREALSLILQALRLSDSAPTALVDPLQRWATTLAAALVNEKDLSQILFLLHHLFRQTRSVSWAARVLRISVEELGYPRVLTLLDLLLSRPRVITAQECTEDIEEAWEELDSCGGGGAVSEGTLRERDFMALLAVMPLSELASWALCARSDIKEVDEGNWADSTGGQRVVRACYNVRALLATLLRGVDAHPQYTLLRGTLRKIGGHMLHALACLHLSTRSFYTKDIEEKLRVELAAAFADGVNLLGGQDIGMFLPVILLTDILAEDYCIAYMNLHDKSPKQVKWFNTKLPVLSCRVSIRTVTQAAADRVHDHQLASKVLEFLFETGLKSKPRLCKDNCDAVARECLSQLLSAHPSLYTTALHQFAELNLMEPLDATLMKVLNVHKWMPNPEEMRAVLGKWSQRCPQLLQHLLLEMNYMPHVGVPLEVQLGIGLWLCAWVRAQSGGVPEWSWRLLRKLHLHRILWHMPLEAPTPEEPPLDLFSTAYALLTTSWGHSIPLICSEGMSLLCKLAASRPLEAVHCLSYIMFVMTESPESIPLTPTFAKLIVILVNHRPSIVQRVFGRGGPSGTELLHRLVVDQLARERYNRTSTGLLMWTWLHLLWRSPLPPDALMLADMVAIAVRNRTYVNDFALELLKEENAKEHLDHTVRNVHCAPLLCESILHVAYSENQTVSDTYARLCAAVCRQHIAKERINVKNAMQQVGANMSTEELEIYKLATALQSAPLEHPSHLTLWCLFMEMYLEKSPEKIRLKPRPAVGPLFFSGLVKSRILNQIKRRLKETIAYHHDEKEKIQLRMTEDLEQHAEPTLQNEMPPRTVDNSLLSDLSIVDLINESESLSESSDSEQSVEDMSNRRLITKELEMAHVIIAYHTGAEKQTKEYLRLLNEGEKVRVDSYYTDISRFIPDYVFDMVCHEFSNRTTPEPSQELDSFLLPMAVPHNISPERVSPPLLKTHFQDAVMNILKIKDLLRQRKKRPIIISSTRDPPPRKSTTALLASVEKHLEDIAMFALEWRNDLSRVSALDSHLWSLVSMLRVPKPLPPIKKQCSKNCKPLTFHITEPEWCVSLDVERAINENRSSAHSAIKRLARPRPAVAKTVAELLAVTRRITNAEVGVSVAERAWACAGLPHCVRAPPARLALTTLIEHIAERWICHKGKLCAKLASCWCNKSTTSLQEALCGALVCPQRLPAADWPTLYITLLTSQLPSNTTFSYLSKFQLTPWSKFAGRDQRRDILNALLEAAQGFGPTPNVENTMLVELIYVHTSLLLDAGEIGNFVLRCARSSTDGTLAPTYWGHIVSAAEACAVQVPFDQLGHLLCELGVIWWKARTDRKAKKKVNYVMYAPYIARLLHVLHRAFVAAAIALSYEPERVSRYTWSALRESWGAWVSPRSGAAPLLPSTAAEDGDHYVDMLRHFVDNVHQIMHDCPGSEVHLLQQLFEWCVHEYTTAQGAAASQDSRVQSSALLMKLAKLPWGEHQWFYGTSLQVALQVSASADHEITSWCCSTWSKTSAATLLRDPGAEGQLAHKLATLLYLFTGTALRHSHQILEEATMLPWWLLPETALEEALNRFFMVHHNLSQPYHELPQFSVILFASELRLRPETASQMRQHGTGRRKRCLAVSQWVRAACTPALAAHAAGHATCLLNTLTELAPYLEDQGAEGELEELLSRAVVIMCTEPAAAVTLPVWVSWVRGARGCGARACLSAAGALTAFAYFAPLADAAARAHLTCAESNGWAEVYERWSSCPWREPQPLVAQSRLHAAYACALRLERGAHALRDAIPALLHAHLDFVDEEPIVAVWICYLCRVARESNGECGASASAVLVQWARQTRRSILRVVTLQSDTDKPTPLHRILCLFAQCVLSPSEAAARLYESACHLTPGTSTDLASWASTPHPRKLPRLAARLLPNHERYFKWELDMAPGELG